MQELPAFISLLFGLTVIGTITWFYFATRSKTFLMLAVGWTILQASLGLIGVYKNTDAVPPRIMLLGIFPTLALMAVVFLHIWSPLSSWQKGNLKTGVGDSDTTSRVSVVET